MSGKHVVIFKNDAVGDLVHSLKAINNICNEKNVDKITIYISKLSEKFNFLINNQKITFKVVNYNLSIFEKVKIFFFICFNNIFKIYILAPKNFYFYLPIFFLNTKFYALCVDNINGYKRPSIFFRRFLYKYVINNRSAQFKRKATSELQNELTINKNYISNNQNLKSNLSNNLNVYLPKNYIFFHVKNKTIKELGWGIIELKLLFNEFLRFSDNVVLTKDLKLDDNTKIFKDNFNSFDFKTLKFTDKSSKIIFFDNIDGIDLYNTILHAKKVVAFHGMMTNLGSIRKQKVLDLFHCKIDNWSDYRNYRNSFYEFKPKYFGYDFTIPRKDMNKTIKKIKFSFKNEK